jgi:hypothetical protein
MLNLWGTSYLEKSLYYTLSYHDIHQRGYLNMLCLQPLFQKQNWMSLECEQMEEWHYYYLDVSSQKWSFNSTYKIVWMQEVYIFLV